MANAYKNKVVYDGTTLIDLSDTTALAADVNSDKYFYLKTGQRVQGSQTLRTISETYSHISSTNTATKVLNGSPFYCDLQADVGYTISSVTVTMGGVDITEDVFTPIIPGAAIYSVSQSLTNVTSTNVAETIVEGGQLYCVLNASEHYLLSSVTVTMGGVDITQDVLTLIEAGSQPSPTPSPTPSIDLQTKSVSITPTESAQTQTVTADSGYDGLEEVDISVAAISSTYVGSGIDQNDSTDLSASGATVTVPAGYYAQAASKSVSNGSATTPATSITANPSISVNTSTGLITATASASQSVTPTVSAGYVSAGTSGTVTVSGSNTEQLSTQAGTTISPTESEQTAVAANKYTLGAVKVGAISSTYVGSGIDRNDSTDLSASGATVSVPAGYYASAASKSVASGSAGTPTATKGTVSNHSVSVTPSVTNTGGYISGGTKTGTAVTVSASELVSGSETKTTNGTYDVTNLAEVVVNVASTAKNIQVYSGYVSRTANSYGATNCKLTVSKAGTYKVTWMAWRGSSSGTMGTNLHVNSTAGTNQQTFTGTYGQCITLNNQTYAKNDVLTIYATSGNNSRTIYVGNLIIEEQ